MIWFVFSGDNKGGKKKKKIHLNHANVCGLTGYESWIWKSAQNIKMIMNECTGLLKEIKMREA